jgi:hypothetical protein
VGRHRGRPCGDPELQRRRAALHAADPRWPDAVPESPADLENCRECGMCSGCLTHNDCLHRFDHIAWFAQFASPGEPACGTAGIVAGHLFTCELPPGHGGRLHRDTMGNGWGIARQDRDQGLNASPQ